MPVLSALLAIAGAYGAGCAATRRIDVPWAVRLATGSALLSLAVFALMALGVARPAALVSLAAACVLGVVLRRPKATRPAVPVWAAVILLVFGFWYLVNASAPETETDPNSYHLIPARQARMHGGFPRDITFYDRLPHATELVFAIPFALAGTAGAKVLHLAFLVATLPLIVFVARAFGAAENVAWGAAVLYFVTPVVGYAGASAFNDAALTFAIIATAACVIAEAPPWVSGLCAGWCYAIKMTGGIAIPAALVWFVYRKRWRDAVMFIAAATVAVAPWVLRNWIETGNPVAPFFNRWFPNPWFQASVEQELVRNLRTYGVDWAHRIPEVLWGVRLQGMLGPMFVLAPVALFAIRRKRQQVLTGIAALLIIPWLLNAGTRFLMPALPFVAIAMLVPLPRVAVVAVVMAHALLSWPQVVGLYSPNSLRPSRLPLRAAVGLESPNQYLERVSWDYRVARMLEDYTRHGDRVLALMSVHSAHISRDAFVWWQSAAAQRAFQAIEFTRTPVEQNLYELHAKLPRQALRGVRVRQIASAGTLASVPEIGLYDGAFRIANRRRWTLTADPNPWGVRFAFDGNLASRWIAWEAARPGQYVAIDFEGTEQITEIRVTGTRWRGPTEIAIDIQMPGGEWRPLKAVEKALPVTDLRQEAMRAIRAEGFTHIIGTVGYEPIGRTTHNLLTEKDEWGLEYVKHFDRAYLFRIR